MDMESAIEFSSRERIEARDLLPGFERQRRFRCEECYAPVQIRYVGKSSRPVFAHKEPNPECKDWFEEDEGTEFLTFTPRFRMGSSPRRPGLVLGVFDGQILPAIAINPSYSRTDEFWSIKTPFGESTLASGIVPVNPFEAYDVNRASGSYPEPVSSHLEYEGLEAISFRWHEFGFRAILPDSRVETSEVLYILCNQTEFCGLPLIETLESGHSLFLWRTPTLWDPESRKIADKLRLIPDELSVRLFLKALPDTFRPPMRLDFSSPVQLHVLKPRTLNNVRVRVIRFQNEKDTHNETLECPQISDFVLFMKGLWGDGNILEADNCARQFEVRDTKAKEGKRYPKLDRVAPFKAKAIDAAGIGKWIGKMKAALSRLSQRDRPYWRWVLAGMLTEVEGQIPTITPEALQDWQKACERFVEEEQPPLHQEEPPARKPAPVPQVKTPKARSIKVSALDLEEIETYFWLLSPGKQADYLLNLETQIQKYLNAKNPNPEKLERAQNVLGWIQRTRLQMPSSEEL